MKKFFYIALFSTLILSACDYVSNPTPELNANLGDTATCPVPTFPTVTVHTKKILIEDFTGHTCPNCPRAARKLHEIDSTYPGRIIGLAIAVGGLAAPNPGANGSPSTGYVTDFRTATGNTYESVFKPYDYGLPAAMFNRKAFDLSTQTHWHFYSNWNTDITPLIAETADADLQIINDFNDTTKKLCCAIKSSFINNLSGTYNVVALLVQDSIIDWQWDADAPAPSNVSNYVHRHMLRDAISQGGAWGEVIATGSANAGDSNTKRYAYIIPAQYNGIPVNLDHCHVVAFIYNTTTYEIIQSEEAKVTP